MLKVAIMEYKDFSNVVRYGFEIDINMGYDFMGWYMNVWRAGFDFQVHHGSYISRTHYSDLD